MKIILKRAIAFTIAATVSLSITACTSKTDTNSIAGNSTSGEEKLFNKPTEISIVIGSHPSWPYQKDWKMWQYFSEGTGAKLNVHAIPSTDYLTKVSLMMSSPDSLPDLLDMWDKKKTDQYVESGVFVSLDDNMDKMPNYTKFLKSLPEVERKELLTQRMSGDGKVYSAPVYGTQTVNNLRSWIYRKDILEKHHLEVPKTMDDLYNVSKKLKEIYPNSYPLCIRDGLSTMDVFASGWQNNLCLNVYYDFKDQKWKYGPAEAATKNLAEYFIRLYKEGLVSPDYLNINTKSWEELMSTDRGFISFEYIVRIDFFNIINRKQNPKYTWATFAPPIPNVPTGQSKITKTNINFSGYLVCNTGKNERIDNAIKLLDWMYSDKGSELLCWGKEGETYHIVDGRRQFILSNSDENPTSKYGVGTSGLAQRVSVESNEAIYSKEQVAECRKAVKYTDDNANPKAWLPLKPEESERVTELEMELGTYFEEHFCKILIGQESISQWDNMVNDLKKMGSEELLSIYSKAYDRVMGQK